jgi:hypothetical protein
VLDPILIVSAAVQPFNEAVTMYLPESETMMEESVAPVFHAYEAPG